MQLYWVLPHLRTILFLGHIIDISIFLVLHFIFLLVMHLPSCSANFERKYHFLELQSRHKLVAFQILQRGPFVLFSLLFNHQHMFQVSASILTDLGKGGGGEIPLVLNWLLLHSFLLILLIFFILRHLQVVLYGIKLWNRREQR